MNRKFQNINQIQLNNNGLDRIYLHDVLLKINKMDIRTALKWCEDNDVNVFSDTSGKFVIQAEFELAYNRPIVELYKKRYGEQWRNVYTLSKENNLHLLESSDNSSRSSNNYKPISREAQNFLNNCA
jgi:hypothetical protein